VSTWQAVRATRAQRIALAERDRARMTVDRFFTQVAESPKLKAQGMEKFRKDLLASAKEFYEGFLKEQVDTLDVRHDLGLAQIRLAKINQVLGDYRTAETLSEKAIEILGELARSQPDQAEYERDLAAAQFELGAVYFDTGNLSKAEAAYEQALAIQGKLAQDHPEVAEYRRALATTEDSAGFLDFRAGRPEKSQASLEHALATWNELLAGEAHVPEDRYGLGRVEQRLGTTYMARGQSERAEATLKEAVDTYQALVHDYPDVPEYRYALARTYQELGRLYFNNMRETDKAEAAIHQGLLGFEKLAQEHPDVLEFTYEVGRCHTGLALMIRDRGRAAAELDAAIKILEQVVNRGYGQARTELRSSRTHHAASLAERGEHQRAVVEANALASEEGLDYVNLYNIACVFAMSSTAAGRDTKLVDSDRTRLKAEYADRGVDLLRQAIARGFEDAPSLKADPDLAVLRSRHDFQKLVQDVEQKSKK